MIDTVNKNSGTLAKENIEDMKMDDDETNRMTKTFMASIEASVMAKRK